MELLSEEEVRKRIKKYFKVGELVGSRTHRASGENAWYYLDYRLLYTLLIIREKLGKPITINKGRQKQRGLRSIAQQMVKNKVYKNKLYLSMHLFGKAVDFDVKGMTAKQVRGWIRANEELFPFKIRLEGGVSWCHVDTKWMDKNPKIYTFTV